MPGVPDVADDGHRGAPGHGGEPPGRDRGRLVVPVQRQGTIAVHPLRRGAARREEGPGSARVLATGEVRRRQRLARPGGSHPGPDRHGYQREPAPPLPVHGMPLAAPFAPFGTTRTSSWSPTRTPQRSTTRLGLHGACGRPASPMAHAPRLEPRRLATTVSQSREGHVDGGFHAGVCTGRAPSHVADAPLAARSTHATRRAPHGGVGRARAQAHHIAVPARPSQTAWEQRGL